jgi:biopolymer transport protein ExbB
MDLLIDAYDYFRPGGTVMVLLVAVSLWMWVLIFERLTAFRAMNNADVSQVEAVRLLDRTGGGTPGGAICRGIVDRFRAVRTGDSALDKRLLEQHAMRCKPAVRRCLPVITVLAAAAPLLGLLGTVHGMVTTFDVIAIFGTGNAKALSGGISKALVTTQSGLLVGIPGLFMSRLLSRRANAIERRITETVIALQRVV